MIPKIDKPKEARFLHDLVERNKLTRKDHTPIPDIPSILNTIAKHPFRSKIDITDGYHNVRIEPSSKEFSSFYISNMGTYRTRVMQQGDCNAPATFMKLMHSVFADMIGKSIYVYLDDILIFSKIKEEHIKALKEVCQKLRQNKLYGNKSKTMILLEVLKILGHTITSDGLSAGPDKILQVNNWPTSKRKKELQGFIGMVNYLSAYVPHLVTVAALLTRLCGDTVKYQWEPIYETSMQQVKDIISAEAILRPLNYETNQLIFLITDASLKGIGAWIGQGPSVQDIHPAAFYSRKFKPSEMNYTVTEKETLAIIDALHHFQPQLAGTKFSILTDHKTCLAFPKTTDVTDRKARWLTFYNTFDCDIKYQEGRKNVLADVLSRYFKNPD